MTFTVTRPKKLYRLTTAHADGSLLDVAGAVMAMLRTAALSSLTELEAVLADSDSPRHAEVSKKLSKFALTPAQSDGIARHHAWLSYIRRGNSTVTLAVCDTCGDVSAVDAAATKCRTNMHCAGKPVKAAFAKQFDPNAPTANLADTAEDGPADDTDS